MGIRFPAPPDNTYCGIISDSMFSVMRFNNNMASFIKRYIDVVEQCGDTDDKIMALLKLQQGLTGIQAGIPP